MGKSSVALALKILSLLLTLWAKSEAQNKIVFCYYTSWSQYRVQHIFFPNDVTTTHCTHIMFSFAKIANNQLAPHEWNEQSRLYPELMTLRQKKPELKIMLAVGGYKFRAEVFSAMAETAQNRATFVSTSITYLRRYGFDGLDLDWEYPAHKDQGGRPMDKENFKFLVQELWAAFQKEATDTGKTRMLLTSAMGVGFDTVNNAYDIPALHPYLDYVSLMTYDLHGGWDPKTGHNAALFTASSDPLNYSLAATVEYWTAAGVPRSKTLVGLSTYGRTFTLASTSQTGVGAAASGPGTQAYDSRAEGVMFYFEICDEALKKGFKREFDEQCKVPYLHKDNQWITYDDVISLQHKMTWLLEQGYAGALVWTVDQDDAFGRSCYQGPYPLMSAIGSCLMNGLNCKPGDGPAPPIYTTPTPVIGQIPVPGGAQTKIVFCYYTSWSQYRVQHIFFPKDVTTTHCTHIMFSFAKIANNQLAPYEWNEQSRLYPELMTLRQKKPGLTIMLAVGGYNFRAEVFSAMAETAQNRATFVSTSIPYLRRYGFDGLDLDWEYPAHKDQGGRPMDKENFKFLVQELWAAFHKEATDTGKTRLLLTSAMGVGFDTVNNAYDIPALHPYLDYVSLMTYDLHGGWDPKTGHNAALFTASSDPLNYSLAATVGYWTAAGVPRSKTLVGLATYGRTFTLTSTSQTGVGAAASGPGTKAYDSRAEGVMFSFEICDEALKKGFKREFDEQCKVPYLHKDNQWITYDDVISLQHKMTWLLEQGYAGALVWTVDQDDAFGRSCGLGPYPLMSVIGSCLMNGLNCRPGSGPVGLAPVMAMTPANTGQSSSSQAGYHIAIAVLAAAAASY